MTDLVLHKDFYQLTGILEPTRLALKARRKDLSTTLREIHSYHSWFGTVRRMLGRIQQHRVLQTLTTLPQIASAVADDLQDKVHQLEDVRERQVGYLTEVNGRIETLLHTSSEHSDSPADFSKALRSKDKKEACTAYATFLEQFPRWSQQRLTTQLGSDALQDYQLYREEALYHVLGCNHVYEQMKIIADTVQRRVEHLHYTLDLYREIIVLGKDLQVTRKGLQDIAEKGHHVYETVKESYSRLEGIMHDLQQPQRLLP